MSELINLKEYNKLIKLMEKHDIPFEENVEELFKDTPHYQICYPCDGPGMKSDAVIGIGTYGWQDGLLEQMGLLPSEVALNDDVQGWLDAETIFKRWAEDFGFFVKGMEI